MIKYFALLIFIFPHIVFIGCGNSETVFVKKFSNDNYTSFQSGIYKIYLFWDETRFPKPNSIAAIFLNALENGKITGRDFFQNLSPEYSIYHSSNSLKHIPDSVSHNDISYPADISNYKGYSVEVYYIEKDTAINYAESGIVSLYVQVDIGSQENPSASGALWFFNIVFKLKSDEEVKNETGSVELVEKLIKCVYTGMSF